MKRMSLTDDFASYKRELAPDLRVSLCDVTIQGGELHGVADKSLEPGLYRFAAEHNIGSRVVFINPGQQYILSDRVYLRAKSEAGSETVNETGYGERVKVYDQDGDSYRVALARDAYLGWLPLTALSHTLPEPSHRFVTLRGHIFAESKVSSGRLFRLTFGAKLHVTAGEGGWAQVSYGKAQTGFVSSRLLWPLTRELPKASPGAVASFARRFLETPYVWGGVSAWGLDCSGLVQTVFGAFGIALPRDADQQSVCGEEVALSEVKVGDLLFFPGHVALSLGGSRFIHANAHHMRVTVDDFESGPYGADMKTKLTTARRILRSQEVVTVTR